MRATSFRELIPALIDHLRSWGVRGVIKANWIEDVYSEVLRGLLQDDLADTAWIDELLKCVIEQLDSLARLDPRLEGYRFGSKPGEGWGWSKSDF